MHFGWTGWYENSILYHLFFFKPIYREWSRTRSLRVPCFPALNPRRTLKGSLRSIPLKGFVRLSQIENICWKTNKSIFVPHNGTCTLATSISVDRSQIHTFKYSLILSLQSPPLSKDQCLVSKDGPWLFLWTPSLPWGGHLLAWKAL